MGTTRLRLLQWFTGVAVAVLLGIHMVVEHLDAVLGFFGIDIMEPTSWESMIGRARQGIWLGLYIALLAFVLYHALYGLRGIILELAPSPRSARMITSVIVAVGIIAFIWGAYIPVILFTN